MSFGGGVTPTWVLSPILSKGTPERYSQLVPADFFFTIDVVDVPIGMFFDTVTGDFKQVVAFPEGQGFHRARFDAAGQFTFLDPGITHRAAHDHRREGVVVLVARETPRAGQQTIAAPDAHAGIVNDGPFGAFREGVNETNIAAGRFKAMIALQLAINRTAVFAHAVVAVDDREDAGFSATFFFENRFVVEGLVGFGEVVHLIAGRLAGTATHAAGGVVQDAIAAWVAIEMLVGRRSLGRLGQGRRCARRGE